MKKILTLLAVVCATLLSSNTAQAQVVDTLRGDSVVSNTISYITRNTTFSNQKVWILKGFVYVKAGATLTIEKGALIKGDKATKGTIIVTRGGKIMADGTADQPIVFTSNQPVGSRDAGDWGGIILLGKAPVNSVFNGQAGVGQIEGGVDTPNGDGLYGGTDPNDNSGILRYIRLEFPGIAFVPNSEINSLTCGGVGRGTVIDYVQTSFGGDDGFEFFGGTVDAKHLISFASTDDDFDTDNGFKGRLQYGIALRHPGYSDKSTTPPGQSNGFESDNNSSGQYLAPYTQSTISNFTMLGVSGAANTNGDVFGVGAQIRRNSRQSGFNSIFMGWPIGGVDINGLQSVLAATGDTLLFRNNIIAGNGTTNNGGRVIRNFASGAPTNAIEWVSRAAYANDTTAVAADLLTSPFNLTAPNFTPKANSVALTGAAFTADSVATTFFDRVSFRGAVGANNWLAKWTNFDPKNTVYNAPLNRIQEFASDVFKAVVYPNPVQNVATVAFDLNETMPLSVTVVDMFGRTVYQVPTQTYSVGSHTLEVDATNLASGFYFVRFVAENAQKTMRFSVAK